MAPPLPTDEMIRKKREEFDDDLVGVVLVYRFGNPSVKPGTSWEKLTYNTVQNMEPDDDDTIEYFWKHCGAAVISNICPIELEKRIIQRIIDIRVEDFYQKRRTRNDGIQSFNTTCGIMNKELYFMSLEACERIQKQRGYPKKNNNNHTTSIAWGIDGYTRIPGISDITSMELRSGGSLLPDVTKCHRHKQCLNIMENEPLVALQKIIQDKFAFYLRCNPAISDNIPYPYKCDDDDDTKHFPMCVQVILGEKSTKQYGYRGFHQDMWSTTGSVIVGVTLRNPRSMTLKYHSKFLRSYELPARSAYVLSGASRFGSIWYPLKEFKHEMHPFRFHNDDNDHSLPKLQQQQQTTSTSIKEDDNSFTRSNTTTQTCIMHEKKKKKKKKKRSLEYDQEQLEYSYSSKVRNGKSTKHRHYVACVTPSTVSTTSSTTYDDDGDLE